MRFCNIFMRGNQMIFQSIGMETIKVIMAELFYVEHRRVFHKLKICPKSTNLCEDRLMLQSTAQRTVERKKSHVNYNRYF